MKKPTPKNTEAPFTIEELFFSTTDKKGIIKLSNDVFVRVSGYEKEVITGAPHNLIRHPDMPKAVFKVFWKYIQNDRPIAAYVKNMAADGSYYWVMAFAFPIPNGYISIRFKPTSAYFDKIQQLYHELKQIEQEKDVDASEAELFNQIKKLGFADYDEFMVSAIMEELRCRDELVKESVTSNSSAFNKISQTAQLTTNELNKNVSNINFFKEGSDSLFEGTHRLESEFKKLVFLSINMKISAGNLGDEARTLGVVSDEFSAIANQIESYIQGFTALANDLKHTVKLCSLHLIALKVQMMMVNYFLQETLAASDTKKALEQMMEVRGSFNELFDNSIKMLSEDLQKLEAKLKITAQKTAEIKKFISALEVVRQTGAIEASRREDVKASFTYYIAEMEQFSNTLREVISIFTQERGKLEKSTHLILSSTKDIASNVGMVFSLAEENSQATL